jgi:hypothetical protein
MTVTKEPQLQISVTIDDGNEFINVQLGKPFNDDVPPSGLILEGVLISTDCELWSVPDEVKASHDSFDGQDHWTATFKLPVVAGAETKIVKLPIKRLVVEPTLFFILYGRREVYRRCTITLGTFG